MSMRLNILKTSTLLTALAVFFAVMFFSVGIFTSTHIAHAAAGDLTGWAWSSNVGWVSSNCESQGVCGTSSYVVKVDDTNRTSGGTGDFSGYAWSSNIGWIDFDPSGPYPEAPNKGAEINWASGTVTGWARALSSGGGWDGWIKLSGSWSDGVELNLSNSEFKGYAWGSSVVGWLSFKGSISGGGSYGVQLDNNPPVASNCTLAAPTAYQGQATLYNLSAGPCVSDPDGDSLTITGLGVPDPVDDGTASPSSGTSFTYTNTDDGSGQDSFSYTVDDGRGGTAGAVVTVNYAFCGDLIANGPESCDDNDLNGQTCVTAGSFVGGSLDCDSSCNFDVSSCVTACGDGIDNDGDGFCDSDTSTCIDGSTPGDPGCIDPSSGGYDPSYNSEEDCNNDNICQSIRNENPANCRVDCDPRFQEI